jgi:glycosyltransferase involved in cell wall biosynthesis
VKLSVIIPSYKDPLSQHTIQSLLDTSKLGNQLEIIQVLDGYWPTFDLIDDPRVKFVHLGKNRGMRGAINAGISISSGEFIMRTDEHCKFAPDFDKIMTDSCKNNWILTAKRYFLDVVKWEVMTEHKPIITEKLIIQNGEKFAGQRWSTRDEQEKDNIIVETMAMQGSMWLMPRAWWDKVIGELDINYGPLYQDSHEIVFKTWQAGGHLMVTKATWFAHKHRSFNRTHQEGTKENPANREQCWKYVLDLWRDYYDNEIRPKWEI